MKLFQNLFTSFVMRCDMLLAIVEESELQAFVSLHNPTPAKLLPKPGHALVRRVVETFQHSGDLY